MDANRAFSGADPENPWWSRGDSALIEYDGHVRHYEVIEDISPHPDVALSRLRSQLRQTVY